MWAFAWQTVKNLLREIEHVLIEVAAAGSRPCGSAVAADIPHVEQQRRVLQKPWYECVVDWHELADAGLQA